LITSCAYDEAGTRLLYGDAIGAVSVHAVPMSAGAAPIYTFQAHDASVSLLCHAGSGLLLTGGAGNLELKLWDASGGGSPHCVHKLTLRHPAPEASLPLLASFEPTHGVLLLSYSESLKESAADLLALQLARPAGPPAASTFGSLSVFSSATPIVSLAAARCAAAGGNPAYGLSGHRNVSQIRPFSPPERSLSRSEASHGLTVSPQDA
jgi:WD40 repeat protein